ncbi:LysR family transcriptional regulator [Vibrio tapetis]|uniref:HTH lysR-type domain-containing protein n=1 Tax=Vibrio tapetis subsp. tapetis TaxID=1671868 RepID=A0A2N8ZMK2_9VIBR|nr:LysR family transcriptional regulator [Vibrio tapetis]SON53102.1 conserved protein of unknown function [Vibrio tapetis subsp. tapetis]
MLNLAQLQTFVVCAEQGSFSAAGRKLGKAQSVVSQSIANLEIDLNQTLFDRRSRSPVLTESGQKLLEYAKCVLTQAQEMEQAASNMAVGNETQLVLCADPALLVPKLFDVLKSFNQRYPTTKLILNTVNSARVPAEITNNKADIGLMLISNNMHVGTEQGFIGQVAFFTVAHKTHPLSQLKEVTRTELTKYPQIINREETHYVPDYVPLLSPIIFESNDFVAMRKMAEAKIGWSYLPAHIAQIGIDLGQLTRLPVQFDIKTWQVPVDRITQLDSSKGPACTWLCHALESVF